MTERARQLTGLLKERYGSPRLNNKDDPLDELFFILLSQMTTGPSYERVFDRLKAAVPDWEGLLAISLDRLTDLIADAGLANQKAPRMVAISAALEARFGRVTLDPLRSMDDTEAQALLTSLPGVGVKTAKCVLMYSLGRDLLPVDTQVARVSRRLSLAAARSDRGFALAVEEAVPPDCRYDYHVNALQHGHDTCRPLRPKCPECPVRVLCPSAGACQAQTSAVRPQVELRTLPVASSASSSLSRQGWTSCAATASTNSAVAPQWPQTST